MATAKTDSDTPKTGEPPSLEALARRFLDLWQSHVAALASDPETNRLLGQLIESQIGAAQAFLKASQVTTLWPKPGPAAEPKPDPGPQPGPGPGAPHDQPRRADPGPPARTEAPSVAPHAGERHMDELTRRLAACEEQLDQLEKRAGG